MTNVRSFIVGLVVLVILFAGGIYVYQKSIKPTVLQNKTTVMATPTPASKFKTEASPSPAVVAQTNVSVAPSTGEDPQNVGITIATPAQNNKISSPATIVGSANVLDSTVNLVILDANRMVLGSTKVTACMDINACPIQASVKFNKSTTATGTIEAYANATATDPQPNLQIINVSF